MSHMSRLSILSLAMLAAFSKSALAHPEAGLVHFLAESDHVMALLLTVAIPVLFWVVLRHKSPE
jgi:hypothetical protein